jgi:hypothetical protein
MIVTERVVRWGKTSLTLLLLGAVSTIGALGERHRGTAGGQPHFVSASGQANRPGVVQFRQGNVLNRTTRRRIVFARGVDERDGGDLWIAGADDRDAQRLTTGDHLSGLAVEGQRIACVSEKNGNVYTLQGPEWRLARVTAGGAFGGAPCWRPGTEQLFVGRGTLVADAGDGGLWWVDVGQRTTRRVLPPVDADFPLNDEVRLSPEATKVAAGGGGDMHFWVRVLDRRTGRQFRQPGMIGILGMRDFAWLDEDNLLVAGAPGAEWEERGHLQTSRGGIRRLDLKTKRLTRWLYSSGSDVGELCRSPKGDRFAVGLESVDTPASVPRMATRIELIDRRTKARHALELPGPAHLCGFSRDGSRLLLLVLSRTEPPTKDDMYRGMQSDAYVFDLRTGACRRVARNAFDAAWMEEPQGGAAGRPHLASALEPRPKRRMTPLVETDMVGIEEKTDHGSVSARRAWRSSSRYSSKSGSDADRPNASSQGFPVIPIATDTWTTLAVASHRSSARRTPATASSSDAAVKRNSGRPIG